MAEKDKFKQQFAELTARAFRTVYPKAFEETGPESVFDPEFVYRSLEKPKDPKMGRFALPVFKYAGPLGDKPPAIASKISDEFNRLSPAGSALSTMWVAGFINAQISPTAIAGATLERVIGEGAEYGASKEGAGKKVLVEYSSCNVAKPFGIGHLRTTIIGNSLRRIFKKLGYDVTGINYLGDWGTQFGKMIVAFHKWGAGVNLEENAVEQLYSLYVRFHAEAETDDSLNDEARRAFKRLEDGESEERALWERFRELSLREFMRVYDLLDVEFDWITGEAFLNDKMGAVIERLEHAGLTEISEGAEVVHIPDSTLPPLLLRKTDGATLYATRDLAGLIYRWDTYRFEESLYVVGTAQSDHFKQAFAVIDLLENAEDIPPDDRMTGRVRHVDFGWVKFGTEMMSTRKGNIIFLEDVILRAVELARQRMIERNPDLPGLEETARLIGTGAVVFSQFMAKRQKDIAFDWDTVLSFEGETGPYLQYTHARLCSLLRNYGREVSAQVDVSLIEGEEEQRVIELLADFPEAIADARRNYDPFFIGAYLLRLAAAFNKVYQRKDADGRIDKIISDNEALTSARIALVKAVQIVVNEGLHLLGIKAPEEM